MGWRVGVDIGGTFTDVALVREEDGRIEVAKVPTTPKDFGQGVVEGLGQALREHGIEPGSVDFLAHGTTVVTNALLTESGARTGLVTTRGFRDVLELRRSARADLYDMFQDGPSVLVPRRRRYEITERVGADGAIVTPLAEAEIDGLIASLKRDEVEAVAVTLLFSFLNDSHERRLGERLRAGLPGVAVFLSSEVLPEIREFERTSTTAVCAYVGPILESYLKRLEEAVASLGLPRLSIMGSSGGVFDVAEALRMPAMAVESGPAAGVIASQVVGRRIGCENLITFDMGGTTAKASLIENGAVETTPDYEVGGGEGSGSRWMNGTGHPIRVPVIDLAEVSAGGGSIAWIDPAGGLRVGPESAGAEPGPVCYGAGGTRPTVTDCNLILGYLDASSLLGGAMSIDKGAAEDAIRRTLAEPMGQDPVAAAAGVIDVVNAGMAEALRIVSVERGHDPREFALIAFGGAGPLHAARLADELEIPEVLVPPIPGGFSALGLVGADVKREYVRTFFATVDAVNPGRMAKAFRGMEDEAATMLGASGVEASRCRIERGADVRYGRQAYELTVPVEAGEIDRTTLDALAEAFHARHEQTYGHRNAHETIQIVNLRVTAIGALPELALRQTATAAGDATKGSRQAWFHQTGSVETPVLDRARLSVATRVEGPAIIESVDSTIVVPPGWSLTVEEAGHLAMRRRG